MKVGIVSDSHANVTQLRRAVELLVEHGAQVLIHCGDIGNLACLSVLADTSLPVYAVAGNIDGDAEQLISGGRLANVCFDRRMVQVRLEDGQVIAVTHGHDRRLLEELVRQGCPYVCHGHTHKPSDEQVGATRLINPGALHHAYPRTVALLDTDTRQVHFLTLDAE